MQSKVNHNYDFYIIVYNDFNIIMAFSTSSLRNLNQMLWSYHFSYYFFFLHIFSILINTYLEMIWLILRAAVWGTIDHFKCQNMFVQATYCNLHRNSKGFVLDTLRVAKIPEKNYQSYIGIFDQLRCAKHFQHIILFQPIVQDLTWWW